MFNLLYIFYNELIYSSNITYYNIYTYSNNIIINFSIFIYKFKFRPKRLYLFSIKKFEIQSIVITYGK